MLVQMWLSTGLMKTSVDGDRLYQAASAFFMEYIRCQSLRSCAACRAECMYAQAAAHFAVMLFSQRMRTPTDQNVIREVFTEVWGASLPDYSQMAMTVTPKRFLMGRAFLQRLSRGKESTLTALHTLVSAVVRP